MTSIPLFARSLDTVITLKRTKSVPMEQIWHTNKIALIVFKPVSLNDEHLQKLQLPKALAWAVLHWRRIVWSLESFVEQTILDQRKTEFLSSLSNWFSLRKTKFQSPLSFCVHEYWFWKRDFFLLYNKHSVSFSSKLKLLKESFRPVYYFKAMIRD